MASSSKRAFSLLRWIVLSSPHHHHHRPSITAASIPSELHKPTTHQPILPKVVTGLPSSWSYQDVGRKSIKHISDFAASKGICKKKTDPGLGLQMRPLSTSGVSEASKGSSSKDPQASNEVSQEIRPEDIEEVIEDSKETRPGWVLKVIVALTVSYMAFHGFPVIGESSIRHSLALLRAEDPIFKRSGAARLALFATTDDRRKSVVKAGGIQRLMSMLEGASEDQTRREAIKALVALAHCEF
ncbi:hypothetical protein O6H91_17G066200 [Diphasiastrum complanatum]|uniref:Uncharacterized protein n=1 Tax=Diphasiastrum complanatum TaxID=34168 RepID=A0ACC2B7R0_DIPCM|nr:hypothetical protein O6H91_17G066200 [Diphasiastrum complanatum]